MANLPYISKAVAQKDFDFTETLLHSVIEYSDELYNILFDEVRSIRSGRRTTQKIHKQKACVAKMRKVKTDAMILVVDKLKFENTKLPSEWYELLHPDLHRSIILCDSMNDDRYDVQYFPFLKMGGVDALELLSNNVIDRIHPCEMMSSIANGNSIRAAVYVMPYSFARQIINTLDFKIIWPTDGYIPLPI